MSPHTTLSLQYTVPLTTHFTFPSHHTQSHLPKHHKHTPTIVTAEDQFWRCEVVLVTQEASIGISIFNNFDYITMRVDAADVVLVVYTVTEQYGWKGRKGGSELYL